MCIGCGYEIVKDDGKWQKIKEKEIKGICPECFSRNPRLVEKTLDRSGVRSKDDDWRRY